MTFSRAGSLAWEKDQAEKVRDTLLDSGELNLYASDGSGVRTLNNLLSESQMDVLTDKVIEFLNDLIKDIELEMKSE